MEKRTMLLTKKILNNLLQSWRIQIPAKLEKELLEEYGHTVATDNGRILEYSEQDICEHLRKIVLPYENVNKEVRDVTLT
jgi:hypothetical protein